MNFDASSRIANPTPPATRPPSAPASEELNLAVQAHMDDIDRMLASMEGGIIYESGTLPHSGTGSQLYMSTKLNTVATGNVVANSADLELGVVATPDVAEEASTSGLALPPFAGFV